MKTFDLTSQEEREKGILQIEHNLLCNLQLYSFVFLDSSNAQTVVIIMGGDGSLGQLVKQLSEHKEIYSRLEQIHFCLLPYGTGNDTAQVLGWGCKSNII